MKHLVLPHQTLFPLSDNIQLPRKLPPSKNNLLVFGSLQLPTVVVLTADPLEKPAMNWNAGESSGVVNIFAALVTSLETQNYTNTHTHTHAHRNFSGKIEIRTKISLDRQFPPNRIIDHPARSSIEKIDLTAQNVRVVLEHEVLYETEHNMTSPNLNLRFSVWSDLAHRDLPFDLVSDDFGFSSSKYVFRSTCVCVCVCIKWVCIDACVYVGVYNENDW